MVLKNLCIVCLTHCLFLFFKLVAIDRRGKKSLITLFLLYKSITYLIINPVYGCDLCLSSLYEQLYEYKKNVDNI